MILTTYDANANITARTDPNGNMTVYEYDSLNRLVAQQYADGTRNTYVYDALAGRITMTDANSTVVTSQYDLRNRLIRKDISPGDGVSSDTTFEVYTYDALSRLVRAEDDDSLVTASYDQLSRLTNETLNGQASTYVYDPVGNVVRCTYPGGRSIIYTYDELDRISMISDEGGTIATYQYGGPDQPARREYSNGTRTDYQYDNMKRLVHTTHTRISDAAVLDDRLFTWDPMGNKSGRRDLRAGGPQLTYDYMYDSVDSLIHSARTPPVGPAEAVDYDLDGVGNRQNVVGGPGAGPYTKDSTLPQPADHQMNQYTTTSFDARTYDKNGNLIGLNTGLPSQREVVYDYRNRMVQHIGSVTTQYRYDTFGRRIERTLDATGTPNTTRYFYSNLWRVSEEQDGAGDTQATYVYGLYIDELLNMRRSGTDYYYHADDLYTIMAVTEPAGMAIERYDYEDYGRPQFFTGSDIPIAQSAIGNAYLFTGRHYDPESSWYYYRTRYLDPLAGRFTTRDTIGTWESRRSVGNAFTYVLNNPLRWVDYYGLSYEIRTTSIAWVMRQEKDAQSTLRLTQNPWSRRLKS